MKHGGNIYQFAKKLHCKPEQIIDFSSNINPEQAVKPESLRNVALTPYADPEYSDLKQAIKQRYQISNDIGCEVFNGASAAIISLLRWLQPEHLSLYFPLYGEYETITSKLQCTVQHINRFTDLENDIPENTTIIFVNPSTPDGKLYNLQKLLTKWQKKSCNIIIDESFLDFCDAESATQLIPQYEKLFIIKSLSKFYGCAGIRIGFILSAMEKISKLKQLEPAWKLSSFDMAYMQQALANHAFVAQTIKNTIECRKQLYQVLQDCGLFEKIYQGQANFLMAQLKTIDGYQLQAQLERSQILIRVCDNFAGLDKRHVRFAVKDAKTINHLANALSSSRK